ncbi:hypothetical protein FMM72_03600 [Anaerotruncus colihominis]|uniref:Uncharacterized protein n=1 Tax=Anaerotruncus colihominis TaxID=169435 RepID=A0A845STX2_9FIRM|nr:hypothetical protein [Anaerotruncus colihominis]
MARFFFRFAVCAAIRACLKKEELPDCSQTAGECKEKTQESFYFTVIRKYSQQLIINAGKQCAKNRQAFSFLERMSVYFLPN